MEGTKRNSVDLQNWATWRHQQTVEQLQKLKQETFGKAQRECTFAPTIPHRNAKAPVNTPTKFMNRLKKKDQEKANGVFTDPEPETHDDAHIIDIEPISHHHNYPENHDQSSTAKSNHTSHPMEASRELSHDTDRRIRELEDEVQSLRAERDDLIHEKKFWLTRFQTDNAKLSVLLKNTKSAKEKLLQEIDNLEKERNRLRSTQADALETSVLDRVLANSPLAEANRSQLPSHMRGKADEVFKTLSSLAIKCRANQAEIFALVISKMEEAESGFTSKREDVLDNATEELRNIASSSPGNVMAAANVAKNFSVPMLACLMDKRDDMLRREGMFPTAGGEGSAEATELNTADAQGMGGSEDLKNLQQQNNTLRASVAQLRKKNAELRAKMAQSPNTPSPNKGYKSMPKSSGGGGTVPARHLSRPKSTVLSGGVDSESDNGDESDTNVPGEHPAPLEGPPTRRSRMSSTNATPGDFENLDTVVQDIAWDAVMAYTREVVRSNPLADRIPVTVLQETMKEIGLHIQSLVTLPLLIAASNKKWGQGSGDEEGYSGNMSEEVGDCIKKTLSIPKVYQEAVAITMMALTYTHSRVSALENMSSQPNASPRRGRTTRGGGTNESPVSPQQAQKRGPAQGLVVLSAELEKMGNDMFDQRVPAGWTAKAYPSLKPLGPWTKDLLLRLNFLQNWIDSGTPSSSGYQGFSSRRVRY